MASLLHDDVLDDAETRRGIGSLNFVMGNKVQLFLFTPQLELIIYIFFLFLHTICLPSQLDKEILFSRSRLIRSHLLLMNYQSLLIGYGLC